MADSDASKGFVACLTFPVKQDGAAFWEAHSAHHRKNQVSIYNLGEEEEDEFKLFSSFGRDVGVEGSSAKDDVTERLASRDGRLPEPPSV